MRAFRAGCCRVGGVLLLVVVSQFLLRRMSADLGGTAGWVLSGGLDGGGSDVLLQEVLGSIRLSEVGGKDDV